MKHVYLVFECDNRLQNKLLIGEKKKKNKAIKDVTNIIINVEGEISEHNLHHLNEHLQTQNLDVNYLIQEQETNVTF